MNNSQQPKKTHADRLRAWLADCARRAGLAPKAQHYGQNKMTTFGGWMYDMTQTKEGQKHAYYLLGKLYGRGKHYAPTYARECARRLRNGA